MLVLSTVELFPVTGWHSVATFSVVFPILHIGLR